MAGDLLESMPLPPPPFIACFVNGFMLACKVIEVGIEYSGDEELLHAFYANQSTLPVFAPLVVIIGLGGVAGWLMCLCRKLPQALRVRDETRWMQLLGCFPVVGIPILGYVAYEIFRLQTGGPGQPPPASDVGARFLIGRARLAALAMSAALWAAPILEFKASLRGFSHGASVGPARGGEHLLPPQTTRGSPQKVPDDLQLLPLPAPPLLEMTMQVIVCTLFVFDWAVLRTGDEVFVSSWGRHHWSVPVVKQLALAVGASGLLRFGSAAMCLQDVVKGVPRAIAHAMPIFLFPIFVVLPFAQGGALRPETVALMSAVTAIACTACTLKELSVRCEGLTHLVRLSRPAGRPKAD